MAAQGGARPDPVEVSGLTSGPAAARPAPAAPAEAPAAYLRLTRGRFDPALRSRSSLGTAEAKGLRLLAHHDLAGHGDGMQVLREGDALYVGHNGPSGMGTSILDVSDPSAPEVVHIEDAF